MTEKWSNEEIQILKDNYQYGKLKELTKLLPNRCYKSICSKARKLGIRCREFWSDEEIEYLKQHYSLLPLDQIAAHLSNRSRSAIIAKCMDLGVQSYDCAWFSKEDEDFVKEHYLEYTDYEMGLILGRSFHAICDKRLCLGLKKINGDKYESLYVYIRRHNTEWKKQSMKDCHFKCVISGERFDEIHHLYSFNQIYKQTLNCLGIENDDIKLFSKEQLEIIVNKFIEIQGQYPLGVCLKKEYHNEFHIIYGNKFNTEEQWKEYYSTHKK